MCVTGWVDNNLIFQLLKMYKNYVVLNKNCDTIHYTIALIFNFFFGETDWLQLLLSAGYFARDQWVKQHIHAIEPFLLQVWSRFYVDRFVVTDCTGTRRNDNVIIQEWRRNDVATSFWRHNDVLLRHVPVGFGIFMQAVITNSSTWLPSRLSCLMTLKQSLQISAILNGCCFVVSI